jgi:hypothetical protein
MKNNDDIPTTDTNEIKQLINRINQGELDQGDALLIEKLLNFLLTIVSLLERKHTSIRRMKEVLLRRASPSVRAAECEDLFDGPAFDQRYEIRAAGAALFGLFQTVCGRSSGRRQRG